MSRKHPLDVCDASACKRVCSEPLTTRVMMSRDILFVLMEFLGAHATARMHVCRTWRSAIVAAPLFANWHVRVDDDQLVQLSTSSWALKHITCLHVSGIVVRETLTTVLTLLCVFKRLDTLRLHTAAGGVNEAAVCAFATRMSMLTRWILHTDAASLPTFCAHVHRMPLLHTLDISLSLSNGSTGNARDVDFSWVAHTQLRTLFAHAHDAPTSLTARQLEHIAQCRTLEHLEVGPLLPLNDASAEERASFLRDTLEVLATHAPPTLQRLPLGNHRTICANALALVARFPALTELFCHWPSNADFDGLHHLKSMRALRSFRIVTGGTALLPATFRALPPSVDAIHINTARILTDEHMRALPAGVQCVHIKGARLQLPAFSSLKALPKLREICIHNCTDSKGDLLALLLTFPELPSSVRCTVEDEDPLTDTQVAFINETRKKRPITYRVDNGIWYYTL